ncbi:MAG: hypothetical protein ABSE22_11650, partial [Xanthobacteraceae bacterium]
MAQTYQRRSPPPKSLEHAKMGPVIGLSGLVGIGIPLMDHRYILLGFLICWASTVSILVLYFDEWKAIFNRLFHGLKFPKTMGNTYIIATIFAAVYFAAPIVIYRSAPQYENYVTNYGTVGPYTYTIGQLGSMRGVTQSKIEADGQRVISTFGADYRLMGILYHHSHSMDSIDEPNISKSGLYDTKSELITILIPWNNIFISE